MRDNINLEYYEYVKEILNNQEFLKRKNYPHHGKITVYDHSLRVSLLAYRISKRFKMLDSRCVAIGGLLHDFYFKPWQGVKEKRPFLEKHGFIHSREALVNSKIYFPDLMNDKIEDIILRHMFPLNITPPRYMEGWLITLADKIVSFEALTEPQFYRSMLGLKSSNHLLSFKNQEKVNSNTNKNTHGSNYR